MTTSAKIVFDEAEFLAEDILRANLVEEFSPLGIILPISRLDLTLYSTDPDFSIINPSGRYSAFIGRQPMAVYEVVGSRQVFLGQFFMDTWDGQSERVLSFSCIDILGLMDKWEYRGGIWLTPITIGDLVSSILNEIDVAFSIDPSIVDLEVSGWIPICSYREALQQIVFAIGGYALACRRSFIEIGRLPQVIEHFESIRCGVSHTGQTRTYQLRWRPRIVYEFPISGTSFQSVWCGVAHTGQSRVYSRRWRPPQWSGLGSIYEIPDEDQIQGRGLVRRPQVTGVKVSMHDIVEGTGTQVLFEGTLEAGTQEIMFRQPMHSLSVTGATITASGANYAELSVATTGFVRLTGLVYLDTISTYLIHEPVEGRENILEISDATLVNSSNGVDVAERIYQYYQQRFLQNTRVIIPTPGIGDTVQVETVSHNILHGIVEKMKTNLSEGFVSEMDIVGIII